MVQWTRLVVKAFEDSFNGQPACDSYPQRYLGLSQATATCRKHQSINRSEIHEVASVPNIIIVIAAIITHYTPVAEVLTAVYGVEENWLCIDYLSFTHLVQL